MLKLLWVLIRETMIMLQPTKCTNVIVVWYSFILIACDGLWKAFTVEAAAKFALSVIEVHPATLLVSIALRIAKKNVMAES